MPVKPEYTNRPVITNDTEMLVLNFFAADQPMIIGKNPYNVLPTAFNIWIVVFVSGTLKIEVAIAAFNEVIPKNKEEDKW